MNIKYSTTLILLCTHAINVNLVASSSTTEKTQKQLDFRIFKDDYNPFDNTHLAARSITNEEYSADLQAFLKDSYTKKLPTTINPEQKELCAKNHLKIFSQLYNTSEYKKAQFYSKLVSFTGSSHCLAKAANHYHKDRCNIDNIRKHDTSWNQENTESYNYKYLAFVITQASQKNAKFAQNNPIDLNPETNKYTDLTDSRLTLFGHTTSTIASFMRYLGKNNPKIN